MLLDEVCSRGWWGGGSHAGADLVRVLTDGAQPGTDALDIAHLMEVPQTPEGHEGHLPQQ